MNTPVVLNNQYIQIPPGSYRYQIIEHVMSDLGREHPETVTE